ncbi:MAG: ABC transporter permease subunit [Candidatus Poribacteria bacterium]|nr:ABC transporter permease subunit [Candidatus Poribacteria bacterium]
MILHIAKKEIHHNLTTLRFALMIILLPLLMIANALIYGYGDDGYITRVNAYNKQIEKKLSHLETYAAQGLGGLAVIGPGDMPKRPSPLKFSANGADEVIPRYVIMQEYGTASRSGRSGEFEAYAWKGPWTLRYPLNSFDEGSATRGIKIDWVFIGMLMSFFAILFTFDAVAGERSSGTLSLMMSNTVSRSQVLLGKSVGAFLTLMVPLVIGILMNLLVIQLSGSLSFDSGTSLRILGMVGLLGLLISAFIFVGLFFSSRVSNAITSLVWLLLTWVFLAFVFPNLLGIFVGNLNPIPSVDEVSLQREAQLKQISEQFQPWGAYGPWDVSGEPSSKLNEAPSTENPSATRQWATYFTTQKGIETKSLDEHIDRQFRQVQLARDLTQISPIATFQYAMEGLANTGIVSYMNFVKQARRYRQTFIDFIKTEDRSDPESLHIYPVKEGLSQKPVDPDAVPVFEERVSYRSVLSQVGLLVLFNLLFFIVAQVSFLMSEIK